MRIMAKLSLFLAVLAALMGASAGCEKSTVGARGKKLTVMKPADQTIQRGETNEVKIIIKRDDFRDPVNVRFEGLPTGVTVQDQNGQIAAEANTATFTLKADPNANLGKDQVVYVKVSAPDGLNTEESFKLTVKDKG
jgi:hypothetical protein